MAAEDGSVKIKVNMDITDVGAGVKDIGAQLKKAGDAAARAGKSMGKSLSKSGWGYDRGAMEFMDNFGKSMEGSAEAARKVIDAYDKVGVSADNAATSVRKLAEEEEKVADAAERAAAAGAAQDEDVADTIHKRVVSTEKALAELTKQGLGPGDPKYDEAYQAWAWQKKEEKEYLKDLAKTPEQREREAAAIEKAAARAEELRQKEEARTEAARQQEAAEAAEAQRLDDIAQSAQVSSQAVVSLTQELEQLQARQQELNAAGVGMGYEEYDTNAERIRAITAALREYAATGSDAAARTMAPDQSSWERFRQKLDGVAGKLRSVTSALSPVGTGLKKLGGTLANIGKGAVGVCVSGLKKIGGTLVNIGKGAVRICVSGLKKMGGLLVNVGKGAAGVVKSGISKLVSGLRNIGSRAKSVNTGLDKMVKSIRNIGLVSVALSICKSLFGELRSVVSSCVSSNEAMSAAVDRLKARISNALAPAISVAINLLERIMPYINALADAFASLMTNIFGKGWTSVSTGLGSVADAAGSASDAVKDLEKNMSGLDELNTWQDKDTSNGGGGGGGGSSSTTAPDTDGLAKKLPGWMTDLIGDLKKAIEDGDWSGAGGILAGKINGLIDSFDAEKWGTDIGGKIQNGLTFLEGMLDRLDTKTLGRKVAALLGSAMNEVKGESLGSTLAAGVKAAFDFVEEFMQTYKGPNIGAYLAKIVNGWFGKMNELDENGESGWTKAGKLINDGIKSVIDGAAKFIDGLDTEAISKGLTDFFAQIKWGDIVKNVRILVESASGKDWVGVGKVIGKGIGDALKDIDPNDIAVSIAGVFESGIKLLSGLVEGYDGPNIGAYLADVVNGWFKALSTLDENGESAFTRAGKLVNSGINGIIKGVTGFINGLDSKTIETSLKQFFGEIKWSEIWDNLKKLAKAAADKIDWKGMLSSLWTVITKIAIWIRTEILGISDEDAQKPWNSLKTKLETGADNVTWLDALKSLSLLFSDIATTLINMIPDEGLGAVWDTLKQKLATSLGAEDWEDLKSQLWDAVGGVLDSLLDLVYEKMGGNGNWLAELLFPHRSEIEDAEARYLEKWESGGIEKAEEYLKGIEYLSEAEKQAIRDKYPLPTGQGLGGQTSGGGAGRAKAEYTITVEAVVDKINTSSLPPEQKQVAVDAITETLDSSDLSPEYKKIVMDATVGTLDSTTLTDNQKSIAMDAIVKTLNSTELPEADKSLVMTALLHAVDGTELTPDEKKILTTAKLDSVIDAIAPKDKELTGGGLKVDTLHAPPKMPEFKARAKVTECTSGMKSNPVISTVSKFVSTVLGLNKDQRTIGTWAKYASTVLGLNKDQRTIGTWAKYADTVLGLNKDQRTIGTWAKYADTVLGLNKDQRTITTWAKYAAAIWSLTEKQRTASAKAKFTEAVSALSEKARTITGIVKATSLVNAIKSPEITVKAKISEIVSSATSKLKSWLGLATGGIYKNGKWQPIEGYASGGSPRSARLFYANENGMPELVGRIGSSTAVMNNGQIVASVAAGVYRAVAAAFGQIGGWFSAMTARLGDIPPAIEMLAAMPAQVPQPVMATGTVIPPRTLYVDGPVQGLTDAVSGLREALDRQGREGTGTGREPTYNVNLNVDGRTLLHAVLSQGRLRQLQSGGNPFMELGG